MQSLTRHHPGHLHKFDAQPSLLNTSDPFTHQSMAGGSRSASNIHVLFIPFLGRSRALSLVDTARLFAQRSGFRCTIVTTPGNTSYISGTVDQAKAAGGVPIDLRLVPFPAADAGLPVGAECTDVLRPGVDSFLSLYSGMRLLRHPIEKLIIDGRPDFIVFDYFLPWYADLAEAHSIPFFLFDTMSPFTKAVVQNLYHATAGAGLKSSPGSATVGPLAGLPHPLEFIRAEVPDPFPIPGVIEAMAENERRSCGVMLNSFEELTPEYVEYCRKTSRSGSGSKLRCIGPVQLYRAGQDAGNWGGGVGIKEWLDSKEPESVLYVSFGSECFFGHEQLREIAAGLQSCEQRFVWVVRGDGGGAETMGEWLPEGFRERVGEHRGMIVTEWAPQVAILNHPAVGGFLTHCGWRSTIEAVCSGKPVIGWPLHSDQFINEKFLVEVVGVGVRILEGAEMRSIDVGGKGVVKGELIGNAVDRLFGGGDEEVRGMRRKAKKYRELARSAMAEGGSSYANLSHVIEQMEMLAEDDKH